jgi:hypothetical protein
VGRPTELVDSPGELGQIGTEDPSAHLDARALPGVGAGHLGEGDGWGALEVRGQGSQAVCSSAQVGGLNIAGRVHDPMGVAALRDWKN